MDISVNKIDINLGNAGKAGAAALLPAAGVFLAVFDPRARIATSAVAGVLALLIIWTLWRGGTVAVPGLTLSGHRPPAEPPAPPATTLVALAPQRVTPPPLPPAADSPRGSGTLVGFLAFVAAVAVVVGLLASVSHAAASSSGAPGWARTSGPAEVAQAYYEDINQRNWPKAWRLAGGEGPDYGTAYQQWVEGYGCTVQDHVTRINAKGDNLLVFVRAQETGGITQNYEFSYIVRHGALTQPQMRSYSGHAPQGCSS